MIQDLAEIKMLVDERAKKLTVAEVLNMDLLEWRRVQTREVIQELRTRERAKKLG